MAAHRQRPRLIRWRTFARRTNKFKLNKVEAVPCCREIGKDQLSEKRVELPWKLFEHDAKNFSVNQVSDDQLWIKYFAILGYTPDRRERDTFIFPRLDINFSSPSFGVLLLSPLCLSLSLIHYDYNATTTRHDAALH